MPDATANVRRLSGRIPAIIPVRRGSVELPNKNMRPINGVPLLTYTITAAKQSGAVSRVIVSTDDEAAASLARSEGVEAIFHPSELSADDAPTVGVIVWNYRRLATEGAVETLLVLRATSPLRTSADIDNAVNLISRNPDADSLVSVVAIPGMHPIRMKRVLPDGMVVDAFEAEGYSPRRRQTLEQLYLRNGAIYIATARVLDDGRMWGEHCLAYVMPQERSVNINTAFDFEVAELFISRQHPAKP
jgi:CMP-N-acetylneuraminic acid synthetase